MVNARARVRVRVRVGAKSRASVSVRLGVGLGLKLRLGLVLGTQSCPTLFNPMDCSPPGSSLHGIFQARLLEWVAIPSSRGSS